MAAEKASEAWEDWRDANIDALLDAAERTEAAERERDEARHGGDVWRKKLEHMAQCERDQRTAKEAAERDAAAVRELMNAYNVGGWTDAISPMKRALAAEAERDAAIRRAEVLHATLRKFAIDQLWAHHNGPYNTTCRICAGKWDSLQPERHAPGCLATLAQQPKESEG